MNMTEIDPAEMADVEGGVLPLILTGVFLLIPLIAR